MNNQHSQTATTVQRENTSTSNLDAAAISSNTKIINSLPSARTQVQKSVEVWKPTFKEFLYALRQVNVDSVQK